MMKKYNLDFNAFENEQQLHEYLIALKQRVLPLKFAYVGRAAHTLDEFVRSQEYSLTETEATLIREGFASLILPTLNGKGLNVFDVGSGNGIKATTLLKLLHQKFSNLEYIGLDYSKELSQIAVANILSKFPGLNLETYQIDFENNDFHEIIDRVKVDTGYSNLFLFLGQTLGNPIDRLRTLANICNSMKMKDTLLIGIELYQPDKIDYILNHYQNELFYRVVFNPLTYAGLQREDGKIDVSFNKITKNIEAHFKLINDISVQINTYELLEFKKEEKFLICQSHRFNEVELRDMFKKTRLNVQKIIFNDDNIYALIYATKI